MKSGKHFPNYKFLRGLDRARRASPSLSLSLLFPFHPPSDPRTHNSLPSSSGSRQSRQSDWICPISRPEWKRTWCEGLDARGPFRLSPSRVPPLPLSPFLSHSTTLHIIPFHAPFSFLDRETKNQRIYIYKRERGRERELREIE